MKKKEESPTLNLNGFLFYLPLIKLASKNEVCFNWLILLSIIINNLIKIIRIPQYI